MDPNAETLLKSDAETAYPDAPQHVAGKKPYLKPDILYLSPLEAMAAVCDGEEGGKTVFLDCARPGS